MSAYNLVNGTYCNENEHLLKDILRNEWNFKGIVVTDWGGNNDRVLGLKSYQRVRDAYYRWRNKPRYH
uniref:Glyco_hydro_3 n=1 Tax=uncultured Butyrivibrio sp. TaxID=370801 RepID=A0A060BYH6_9FIRM|nr:Glyco_hydro_3 [uncultured Butyrivibrio sp.]